jgi:hypothetical protein
LSIFYHNFALSLTDAQRSSDEAVQIDRCVAIVEAHARTGQITNARNRRLICLLIGDDDNETAALLECIRRLGGVVLRALSTK